MIAPAKDLLVLGLDVGSVDTGVALVSCPPSTLLVSWPSGKATVLQAAHLGIDDTLAILDRLAGHVDLVVVEPPGAMHPGFAKKKGMGAAVSYSRETSIANRLVGRILERCAAIGHRYVEIPATEWRHKLAGARGAKNRQVTDRVGYRVAWGPATNEHERDAVGCALWGAIKQAEEARRKR